MLVRRYVIVFIDFTSSVKSPTKSPSRTEMFEKPPSKPTAPTEMLRMGQDAKSCDALLEMIASRTELYESLGSTKRAMESIALEDFSPRIPSPRPKTPWLT